MPLQLTQGSDVVIGLREHSVEGEVVDILSQVLLIGNENVDATFDVFYLSLFA